MRAILFLALLSALPGPLAATVVGVGVIEQPVNLGAQADGSRIPLGPVPYSANHGYGIHRIITKSRPCTHGELEWKGGIELNMNLASAFGISVEPEDDTQVMHGPVTIRVRDWPVPAYSPYSKKQVVAATLHCLLRSVYAAPKRPLEIRMLIEDPEEVETLSGFTGKYINFPAKGEEPTRIPGTSLVTDDRGVTLVTFAEAQAPSTKALRRTPPLMVPFHFSGGDSEYDIAYSFLPIWVGDTWSAKNYNADERTVLSHPISLFYDVFDPSQGEGRTWNTVNRLASGRCYWHRSDEGDTFGLNARAFDYSKAVDPSVAATCYAAILTALPTETRPLTISLHVHKDAHDALQVFKDDPAWTVSAERYSTKLSCQFVWDRSKGELTKGSIPGRTIGGGKKSGWYLKLKNPRP